jgi:CO dehydrogenase/acetyl-CoA synthase gamma subunit (corrinoid Fe-S protein)
MDASTIPGVDTRLTLGDRLGRWRVRWSIGRGSYRVEPGLYRVGRPGPASPVLVTANYKLTFDALRSELEGVDAWILVLETQGVNVWCAAGKGTFGTDELVNRVAATRLTEVVSHRKLVVPQLGARCAG